VSVPGSDWVRLFRIACSLIRQANSEQAIIDTWALGGGTAMMLQINHRRSDDIDIFLPDAQLLPYLDPKLRDFDFEIMPSDYHGDGSRFLKLAFEDVGEIDFIVSPAVTSTPTIQRTIEGEEVALETIAEIITKKVHFRGGSIKPRDIFDIAAAARSHREQVVHALRAYKDDVAATLAAIDRLKPDFVRATIAALAIEESYRQAAATALEDATGLLRSI
jgi:Nucleotidyl transferase AbiEii toxin, Type IV TA system